MPAAQRALLVAPTVEQAARLAEPFDDVRVVTTVAEFDEVWATDGGDLDVVAVTASDPDTLAHVADAVRSRGPGAATLVVDFGGPIADDPAAQIGFDAPAPDAALATREVTMLRGRIEQLQAELAATRAPVASTPAATAVPRGARLRRPLVVAAAAVIVAVAACIVLAVLTDTGYVGALAGLLVLLGVADLLYAWRSNRWRAAVDARTAKTFADMTRHAAETQAALARTAARLDEIEQSGRETVLGLRVVATTVAHGLPGPDADTS